MRKQRLAIPTSARAAALLLLVTASGARASATSDFERWLDRYEARRVDLYRAVESGYALRTEGGGVRVEYYQNDGLEELDRLLEGVRSEGGEAAARVLLDAAVRTLDRDPQDEARRFVAQQPWIVRRRAAETLALLEDGEAKRFLRETALKDRSPLDGTARRRVAAAALGQMRDAAAAPVLARRVAEDPSPSVRAASAESLGRIGGALAGPALEAALGDEDAGVRLEALLALSALSDAASDDEAARTRHLEGASRLLNDPHWPLRLTAARALGDLGDAKAVPPLLAALLREAPAAEGARRRVRSALRAALGRLTGEDFPASRPDEWAAWWAENASTFDAAEAAEAPPIAPEQGARFFGIPLEADEVVFLMDVSGSMDRPATDDPAGPTRLFVARRELRRCLDQLEDGTRFNVILFHEQVVPFRPRPVAKDAETAAAAQAFVDAAVPAGGTNLYGALEFALGPEDPAAARVLGEDLDTIVLLTDGKPSRGPILVADEILHQVATRNRGLGIAIHTVAAGGAVPFLEELARQNSGGHASLAD